MKVAGLLVAALFSSAILASASSLCDAPDVCGKGAAQDGAIAHQELSGDENVLVLANGFVCVCVSAGLAERPVVVMRGDVMGKGDYGKNVLSGNGFSLDAETVDGKILQPDSDVQMGFFVDKNESSAAVIRVTNLTAGVTAIEDWTMTLLAHSPSVEIATTGRLISPAHLLEPAVTSVHHSTCMVPTSIYGLFDRGVVQMKAGRYSTPMYPSQDRLTRLYALGGSETDLKTRGDVSLSIVRDDVVTDSQAPGMVALLNTDAGTPCWSGFREVVSSAQPKAASLDEWGPDPARTSCLIPLAQAISAGNSPLPATTWSTRAHYFPANMDIPTMSLFNSRFENDLPAEDLHAMVMGVWPSIVGNLNTHDNEVSNGYHVAQIATTIHHPDTGYAGTYNYFDPDNFIGTAALLLSGDSYLQEQARAVMERTGAFINEHGQIPHHFVGVDPIFQALSGATQTGPNVFWILSCLNYAKTSGNMEWLQSYMPTLRNASRFLFDLIDPEFGLIRAPGSLMIDVFIRENFTSDSNAMIVGFFRELAEAEYAVQNDTGAKVLVDLADSIADSMNKHLWASDEQGGDHYITQVNPDGSKRDFIDYDSNLIAVAHGIPQRMNDGGERTKKLLARVDSGRCVHGRATFVSEDYYGPADTTHGNVGDSWCSMARIGWFDALARRNVGDLATFDNLLVNPLKKDLLEWVWLHERYACDGSPQLNRTQMYFEYPATVTMMLREIRYGINMGLRSLQINPFGPSQFTYSVGNVMVRFSSTLVEYQVPRSSGLLDVTLSSLVPNTSFTITTTGKCSAQLPQQAAVSTKDGVLRFTAPAGVDCLVRVST